MPVTAPHCLRCFPLGMFSHPPPESRLKSLENIPASKHDDLRSGTFLAERLQNSQRGGNPKGQVGKFIKQDSTKRSTCKEHPSPDSSRRKTVSILESREGQRRSQFGSQHDSSWTNPRLRIKTPSYKRTKGDKRISRSNKTRDLLQHVKSLMKKHAIEEVRKLNIPKFKMETSESIRMGINQDHWTTFLDFLDVYLHIPVHRSYRKYLRFVVDGRIYQFGAMPFGLGPAPLKFVQLIKPVKVMTLRLNLQVFQYIDDWLN